MTLNEALVKLAEARRDATQALRDTAAAWEAVEATAEGQKYGECHAKEVQAKAAVADLETQVRDLTLASFSETGDKAPAPGVVVKLFRKVTLGANLLDWLKVNGGRIFITEAVDTKAVTKSAENLAEKGAPITIENDPRPQIASDLSAYLPQPVTETAEV